jgi:hypothetical protein
MTSPPRFPVDLGAAARTLLLAATLLAACATRVPPAAVAWKGDAPVLAPKTASVGSSSPGYLKVETDTDPKAIGRNTYYNLRRPYDIYSEDGRIVRAEVDNQGGRSGEEPSLVSIPPGRYVVATMVGTVYRKVQVVVASNAVTEVSAEALRGATPVFGN